MTLPSKRNEKIVKRLDKQIAEWKKHMERCGFHECKQQLETLEYVRYGRIR